MTLRDDKVTLSHGGGGKAMRDLIAEVFTSVFEPTSREDQARLTHEALLAAGAQLAFTTDSYVVTPVEFPGGDIGKIAVCGTVNDLAVGGAKPLWLSAAFIIEEGTEIALLRRIVASMKAEADKAGVKIVTGDTKVVGRGSADKVFITTSGVGVIPAGRDLRADMIQPGDVAIVNGVLGDHGATILAARGDMMLSSDLQSDCAALGHLMEATCNAVPVRACRDATRGGIASALNEMAEAAGCTMRSTRPLFPFGQRSKAPAKSLALIRSIWRMRERLSSLSLPNMRTRRWRRCGRWIQVRAQPSSVVPKRVRRWLPCAPPLAAVGLSICSWENSCRGFVNCGAGATSSRWARKRSRVRSVRGGGSRYRPPPRSSTTRRGSFRSIHRAHRRGSPALPFARTTRGTEPQRPK